MAGKEISKYIIGIIVFTMFIMGGIAMIGEFGNVDDTFIDENKYSNFTATFNRYNEVIAETENLQESIESVDSAQFGLFGVLNGLIETAWNTIRTIFTSFGFMFDVFKGIKIFGIPVWVGSLIVAIITVIIVFAIIAAIFQRDI